MSLADGYNDAVRGLVEARKQLDYQRVLHSVIVEACQRLITEWDQHFAAEDGPGGFRWSSQTAAETIATIRNALAIYERRT